MNATIGVTEEIKGLLLREEYSSPTAADLKEKLALLAK
jgi:hypothetical protein